MQKNVFPEWERPIVKHRSHRKSMKVMTAEPRIIGGPTSPRSSRKPATNENPCVGCPREHARKVLPVIPQDALAVCIGMAPGEHEEDEGTPFVGPAGTLLRSALTEANLEITRIGFANLGRCRPENDDFETPEWTKAEQRCWRHLNHDLASVTVPLVLLGTRPVQRFLGGKNQKVTQHRGLWEQTPDGRRVFVARHPSGVLRSRDDREHLERQFREDIQRLAAGLNGQATPTPRVPTFRDPFEAREFLAKLAKHPGPWSFDIEAFDAGAFPSRPNVATDPCHPDFRLRGVAFAWGGSGGAWVDCFTVNDQKHDVRALLDPVFSSDAEKWAFNGSYDEEGLVYPGWVTEINARSGDGMLAMVALGDGRHESLRLEKATADLLKRPQAWDGFDKAQIRDLSIDEVARGAVADAKNALALCRLLHDRLTRGEYL